MFNLKEDENDLQLGTSDAKRESDKDIGWSPRLGVVQTSIKGYGKLLIKIRAVSKGQNRSPMWTQGDLLPNIREVSMDLPQGPRVVLKKGRKRWLVPWPREGSKRRPGKL